MILLQKDLDTAIVHESFEKERRKEMAEKFTILSNLMEITKKESSSLIMDINECN